jgi:1-acyl-sn-glycerol-3-phosphate acyltransferase
VTLVRSLIFHIWFLLVSVVMFIGAIPLFLAPRIVVMRAAQVWATLILWGLKIFCGQTYKVRGNENIPKGAALVAPKHYSMWETIAMMVLSDDPAIILKRELLRIPFYGWYGAKMGMIGIDRSGKASALRAMRQAARSAKDSGRQIVIFPEGTRRAVGAPPEYHAGVAGLYADLDLPCVPVAHNSGLFWTNSGLIKKPGTITVEFLAPIAPGMKRSEFMRALEERIEGAAAKLLAESAGRRHASTSSA